MPTLSIWTVILVSAPAIGAWLSRGRGHRSGGHALALAGSALGVLGSSGALIVDPTVWAALWTSLIAFVAILVMPRSERNSGRTQRLLLGQALTGLAAGADEPWLFAVAIVGVWYCLTPVRSTPAARGAVLRRVNLVGGSVAVLLALWVTSLELPVLGRVAGPALLAAAWLRKGMWPLHPWVTQAVEDYPLSTVLMLLTPQLETVALLRWWLPTATPEELVWLRIVATVGAMHGALAALTSENARRGLAYFFLAQTSMVIVALSMAQEHGPETAIVLWLANALAFAGFGLTIHVLEARRGRLSLAEYHGGYDQTPMLAMVFLVLGLCATGFPGTLGFVGAESLVEGLVETAPWAAVVIAVVLMFNGVTVLRMYLRLFGGRKSIGAQDQKIRRREIAGFGVLATVLALTGIWPRWILELATTVGNSLRLGAGS